MKLFIFLYTCYFSSMTYAQNGPIFSRGRSNAEKASSSMDGITTERMSLNLQKLQEMTADQYLANIDRVRLESEQYLEIKRKVCMGELAPVILESSGRKIASITEGPEPLSKQEKEICNNELLEVNLGYVEALFKAREMFLVHSHQEAIQSLRQAKEAQLNEIKHSMKNKRKK